MAFSAEKVAARVPQEIFVNSRNECWRMQLSSRGSFCKKKKQSLAQLVNLDE